jgi:hypothetical protein
MLRFYVAGLALASIFCAPAVAQTATFTARLQKNCLSSRHCSGPLLLTVTGVKSAAVSNFVIAGTGVGGPPLLAGRLRRP